MNASVLIYWLLYLIKFEIDKWKYIFYFTDFFFRTFNLWKTFLSSCLHVKYILEKYKLIVNRYPMSPCILLDFFFFTRQSFYSLYPKLSKRFRLHYA